MNDQEAPVTLGAPEDPIVEALCRKDVHLAIILCADLHGPSLGRFAMALLGSQSEADDVVQDILLEAHRTLPRWEQKGPLKAYLFTIARRKCARALELQRTRDQKLSLLGAEPAPTATDAWSLKREQAELARAALAELKPTLREAVVLRFVAELSFTEISEALAIDEPAARQRVSRGLRALQASVRDEETI